MDGQDEVITNISNIGAHSSIVKGKRTKRQRPQSPIPFRMLTAGSVTTANSYKSDEAGSDISSNNNNNNNNEVEEITTMDVAVATTTILVSDDDYGDVGATTEEEEEMANCLILLAQGHSRDLPPHPPTTFSLLTETGRQIKEDSNSNNNNNNNISASGNNTTSTTKFVSRKFMESGKSGYYVYECKTCSKTFSSFQALGGHRASHKKPKNKDDDDYNNNANKRNNNYYINNNIILSSDDDEAPLFKAARHNNNNFATSTSLSLQLTNRALYSGIAATNHQNKGRVHECSICGAEFSSGQALGGHMRRHRGSVNPNPSQNLNPPLHVGAGPGLSPQAIAAIPLAFGQPTEDLMLRATKVAPSHNLNNNNNNNNNNSSSALSLDLDLNLPAPPEDGNAYGKLAFDSEQQPPLPPPLPLSEQEHPPQTPPIQPPPPPPPPPQQPTQQQIVFPSPTLVDCHY